MLTLLRAMPFSADGDAEGKGMLEDDVRSDCGGLVVVLRLLVASDLFVMVFDHTVVLRCFHVVRCFCMVPLAAVMLMVSWVGPLAGLGRPARGRSCALTLAMIRVELLLWRVGPHAGLGRPFRVSGLRPGVQPIPTLIHCCRHCFTL